MSAHRGDEPCAHHEAGGVEAERQRRRDHEQPGPERSAGELVGDQVAGHQAGVGPREPGGGHDGRQQREGGVVGQGPTDPEQEQGGVDHRDAHRAAPHRHGQPGQGGAAEQVDGHQQPPPIQPVHVGPARQAQQQPGKLLGEHRAGDQRRVAGQRRHQQRRGHPGDPVAQVRHRAGGPQLDEVGAERGRPSRPSPHPRTLCTARPAGQRDYPAARERPGGPADGGRLL
jgi:hypothetical protein